MFSYRPRLAANFHGTDHADLEEPERFQQVMDKNGESSDNLHPVNSKFLHLILDINPRPKL